MGKNFKLWKSSTISNTVNPPPPPPNATAGPTANGQPPQVQNPNLLPRRRATDKVYKPTMVNGKEWFPEIISAYDLKWENLRAWLVKRYEKEGGAEWSEDQSQDTFFFWVPKLLTKEERLDIDKLREPDESEKKRRNHRARRVVDKKKNFDDVE